MKILSKVTLLTIGLASVTLPFLAAADVTAPSTAVPAVAGQHARLRALLQRRKAAARRTGLSRDQIAQMKTLRAQTRSSLKSLRSDAGLSPEQKKAKARELRQSALTQLRSTLTPEQKAQLKQLRQHRRKLRQAAAL